MKLKFYAGKSRKVESLQNKVKVKKVSPDSFFYYLVKM